MKGGRRSEGGSLQVLLKLSCYQFKIGCYKIVHVSLMVVTKEKSLAITQKNMIKKSKHTDTKRHQNTKIDSRKRSNEQ